MIYIKIIFSLIAIISSFVIAKHMVATHGAKAMYAKREEVIHDHIFNFLGAILGWAALYYLVFYGVNKDISTFDLLLVLVGFIGISGYLPHIIINKGFKP